MAASAGIGMVIGTVIKNVQGATMTGVGISVVSAAVSGVMVPYSILPEVLKIFLERGMSGSSARGGFIIQSDGHRDDQNG